MGKIIPYAGNLCSKDAEKMISIKIGGACNARCSFCVDRGGYNAGPLPNVLKIAEEANRLSDYKTVIITGGEPFLYFDETIALLKILRPNKTRLVLNTNGSLLTQEKVKTLTETFLKNWEDNYTGFETRSDEDLIAKGCTVYVRDGYGILISIKRLCKYAKGKNATAFSCCFINNDGQAKIDVDTKDTFKVIYADGTVTNDWIFKGL